MLFEVLPTLVRNNPQCRSLLNAFKQPLLLTGIRLVRVLLGRGHSAYIHDVVPYLIVSDGSFCVEVRFKNGKDDEPWCARLSRSRVSLSGLVLVWVECHLNNSMIDGDEAA